MYKNLLLIMAAAAFMISCGGQNATTQEEQTTQQEEVVVNEPVVIALADFAEKAESLVGQEVFLEGTVIHVCKHGGKKMFITADDPDVRIKITTGEETAAFDTELEGSYVKVTGVVNSFEVEVEEEHEEGEHEEDEDHKNIYHKKQYSVSCIDYTVEEVIPEQE